MHIYGYPADMDEIMALAGKYDLCVIEDAAEAIGTVYNEKSAGSMGDMGCFSFFANKLLTCGDGGMIVTDDEKLAEKATSLKNLAFGNPRFIHDDIGYNFRMNNLTAAYAYASFEELDKAVAAKTENARLYSEALSNVEGITLPPESEPGSQNSYWMYGILVDEKIFGRTKDEVRTLLKSEYSIDTRDFFYPMHKQPAIIQKGYESCNGSFPIAEKLWNEGLYLPSGVTLKPDEIGYVCDALAQLKR